MCIFFEVNNTVRLRTWSTDIVPCDDDDDNEDDNSDDDVNGY